MQINPNIFRSYDIRGVYPDQLSLELAKHIGMSLGTSLRRMGKHRIAIGRDGRLSGQALSQQLSKGIISTGCEVIDIGQAPTPLVYYASKKIGDGSCAVITGSHNPAEYNGIKMVLNHETLSDGSIQNLHQQIIQRDYDQQKGGTYTVAQIQDQYIQEIAETTPLDKPLKIVIDAGNGVAGHLAPRLMRALGCQVIELYCEIDGNFPNHHPDPSKQENMRELQQSVLEHQADVGIAYDGDGDRIGVVDSEGTIVNADRLIMLFSKQVLENNAQAEILFDVKCSAHVPRWVNQLGGKATMCRTGHSHIKKALLENNAQFAGEFSGHIFFNDRWYGFDDALYATARLSQLLSQTELSSKQLFDQLPNSIGTPELTLWLEEGENFQIIEKIKQNAHFPGAKITTIDGLRVDFQHGWGLIRASNTTPSLVLRFEADDEQHLSSIQAQFRELLEPHCPSPLPL